MARDQRRMLKEGRSLDSNRLSHLQAGDQLVCSPATFSAALAGQVDDDILMSPAEPGLKERNNESSSSHQTSEELIRPGRKRLGLGRTIRTQNVQPVQPRKEHISIDKSKATHTYFSDSAVSEPELVNKSLKQSQASTNRCTPTKTPSSQDPADQSIVISDDSDDSPKRKRNKREQINNQSNLRGVSKQSKSQDLGHQLNARNQGEDRPIENQNYNVSNKQANLSAQTTTEVENKNKHLRFSTESDGESEAEHEHHVFGKVRTIPEEMETRNQNAPEDDQNIDDEIQRIVHPERSTVPRLTHPNNKDNKAKPKRPYKKRTKKGHKANDQPSLHSFVVSDVESHSMKPDHEDNQESVTDKRAATTHQALNESKQSESDIFELQEPNSPSITSVTPHKLNNESSSDETRDQEVVCMVRRRKNIITSASLEMEGESHIKGNPL